MSAGTCFPASLLQHDRSPTVSKLRTSMRSRYLIGGARSRWLGVRLDLLGNILVLGIGVFGVAFRNSVSPSKLGVVLTYSLQATQVRCLRRPDRRRDPS